MADRKPTAVTTVTFTDKDNNVFTRTIDPDNFLSVTDIAASLDSEPTETPAGEPKPTESSPQDTSLTPAGTQPTGSTLVTSTTLSQPGTTTPSAGSSTGVASGSESENPSASQTNSCDSISCNAGLQAAIAVPVVVGTLLILILAFLCIRRRKRRQASTVGSLSEKRQRKPKKWSRHLRIFSFDAELLMGGRFSSSNSLRSGETGSQRSRDRSRAGHNASPSIHSVDEEVAPPYRDAMSHVQPPSTVPMAAGLASSTSDPFIRPDSVATAPPPYPATSPVAGAAAAANLSRTASRASTAGGATHTPVSTRSLNDPFRNDTHSPISPVDDDDNNHNAHASPFVDPPEVVRSPVSPSESTRMFGRRVGEEYEDARSTVSSVVEVGTAREAVIGRTLSSSQRRRV